MTLGALFFAADTLVRSLGSLPTGVTDGWATTLRGERFSYHSAHPTSRASLLVRSLDSTNAAAWQTAPVATAGPLRHLTFLAAMDVADPGQTPVRFWMTVNGHRFALPQPSTAVDSWRVDGADGISLRFRRLVTDKFGDVHGVFTLEVPAAIAPTGVPVTLQVQGESVERMSWFILYTVSMQPVISAHGEQLLTRQGDARLQTIRLDAWSPFDTMTVTVSAAGLPPATQLLAVGATTFRVTVPAVPAPTTIALTVRGAGGTAAFDSLPLAPVVPREIWLISHAHLDIGYTDVPAIVREKHWRGIDSALAYIERSRGNPEGARFAWNVEGLWPLQDYLARRPAADTARLLAAVRRGDVALSALYANLMTGLSGSEELMHLLDFAQRLRRDHAVPVTVAMTSDVPGFTWGLVPALARQGIRYLSSGPNYIPGPTQDGDRIGHTLQAWGDRPFWWIGPDGGDSLLVMIAGRGYSWVGGWPRGRMTLEDAGVMSEYLEDLVAREYPWDIVQVRVAIGGDNGGPDPRLADVVREWNQRYASPRLVIGTLPAMFAAMERRHGAELPRIRGDLTGYWEDGAVSTLAEQVMARASAARLVQAGTLAALRGETFDPADREAAWRSVVLWDEHTWGADRSISEPDAPATIAQWQDKRRLVLDADSASRALLALAARRRGAGRGLDIWNTHEAGYRGVIMIPDSLSTEGDRVRDAAGRTLASQRLRDRSLAVRLDLQPLGATRIVINSGAASPPATEPPARAQGDSIWNGRVVVRVNPATGAIASVRWQGRELVDPLRGGWNRYRYVPGIDTSGARDAAVSRIEVIDDGPLVATLRITSDAPGANRLVREVTLYAGDDAVRLVTHLDKAAVREKEAVHIAFPLLVPGGLVRMEQGFAVVRPDSDQAEGANRNVYPVQRWLDASNGEFGVSVLTPDLPLWELNGLTAEAFRQPDGREDWLQRALPGTELITYAMNNYWHTNFKADQPGPVTFRVVLVPHSPFDAAATTRAALEISEPPVVLRADGGPVRRPRFVLEGEGVVVSSVTADSGGSVVSTRLWNPGDKAARVQLRWEEASPTVTTVPALGSVVLLRRTPAIW
ncbi:MAG: glycoside hydrolase family 38 C-terminal domain-containing protein [Gemmatimonadota bacterium]